ncbi:MAG: NADH-quinone oxidoreductase subunit NuoK [Planctomycetota bacterium]|nr:MAG: NADH-quinone oxidoreductase subunit NuoK [Planctomycetota bacterium]
MITTPQAVQIVAAALFAVGVYGVLARRNLMIILMSVELMLNGVNLSLVGFSREMAHLGPDATGALPADGGQVLVLMAMAVAAAEVAVGLSILIAIFRHIRTVDVDAPRATALRD